ncbi:MAG: TorF family putative porin [Gemmatimonadota bacterium]
MRTHPILLVAVSLLGQAAVGSVYAQIPSFPAQGRVARAAPALGAASTDSGTTAVELYAETRLVSRYIWRGYDVSMNTASVQPWVELSLPLGFTANAFTTSALDRHRDLDEAQLGVGNTREIFGEWEFGVGYLHYVMPGTETEPGADEADPLAPSTSGEFYAALTRNWDNGYATLTYSRGNRSGKGNSVNLWVQQDYSWGHDRWTAQPYFQIDYLDEYGAPAGLEQRLAMIEIGLPVLFRVGPVQLLAAAQVSFVPSPWVRASNGEASAGRNLAIPWFSVGLVYEPD